jgi:hypothetical protein
LGPFGLLDQVHASAQRLEERVFGRRVKAFEQVHQPGFVLGGHQQKVLTPGGCQAHDTSAGPSGSGRRSTMAFGGQLVGQAGDVAAGDHQVARQRVHAQALGVPFQLRQVVKARQRGRKTLAQPGADFLFDLRAARQEPQPQLDPRVITRLAARFAADGLFAQLAQKFEGAGVAHTGSISHHLATADRDRLAVDGAGRRRTQPGHGIGHFSGLHQAALRVVARQHAAGLFGAAAGLRDDVADALASRSVSV